MRRRGWTGDATITNCVMNTKIWFNKNSFSTEQFPKYFYLKKKIQKVGKYFNGKISWNRFTGPIESECFAALRITCSKCRECSAKTVASLCVKLLAKKCVFRGNIGLCVPEPINITPPISQHRQIKFLQFWAAVFGASLGDHDERFTRNDLKNLREWSVKRVILYYLKKSEQLSALSMDYVFLPFLIYTDYFSSKVLRPFLANPNIYNSMHL